MSKTIGFIGQGWIGRNYANDFENRGFTVVRYALEEPYVNNGDKIADCDIVFVAVPTPTTEKGFDDSILRAAIKKIGKGKIAVIKSTVVPGTTESIQAGNPDSLILHSPEFLRESSAAHDAAHPNRNIIGIPLDNEAYRQAAQTVLSVLPKAGYELVCSAKEAELVKYMGNSFLYLKVVYINMLYDLAKALGCRWETVAEAFAADPRIGASHLKPVHASGHVDGEKGGRGAGGHCFIKDFAALTELYKKTVGDEIGLKTLDAIRDKNIDLLAKSGKDLELLTGVYGNGILNS
jgi:nucleotide sugar dehydrogenase